MYELLVTNAKYGAKASDGTTQFTEGAALYDTTGSGMSGNAAATSLNLGSLALFNDNQRYLQAGATTYTKYVDYVTFGIGQGTDKQIQFSNKIRRDANVRIDYQPYVPAVKQVNFIGAELATPVVGNLNLNAGSTLVPAGKDSDGYEAIVVIDFVNNEYTNLPLGLQRQSYEITVPHYITTDDSTYTAEWVKNWFCDQLVAKINNKVESIVVAAKILSTVGSHGIGISLTTKDYNIGFVVSVSGFIQYATVVTPDYEIAQGVAVPTSKNCKLSQGSPDQMFALQRRSWVEAQGYNERDVAHMWRTWKEKSAIQIGANKDGYGYSVVTISYDLPHNVGEMLNAVKERGVLQIAIEGTLAGNIPSGAWTVTTAATTAVSQLATLLPVLFGLGIVTTATAVEPADEV